ncbi:Electron transporter RnfA [Pseudomonas reidholzensis]|uniref:Electron transporter RnfA n=1 Tax=Pseudomonas reidholzensis TaxID=1785162 RepID=A0A383RPY5_9PSED|nr:Rnf-Nqr domain containing protein [Pseudomonas reidholzensis]SYX89130.1 Electron transporter RnfA [Pseudomonas reidholzensis]
MSDYVLVLVSAALVNHLILQRGSPTRVHVHLQGAACALLMLGGLVGAKLLDSLLLVPLQLHDLQLFVLLPVLALLAWSIPALLARRYPETPLEDLRIVLLSNAAVLGLMLQLTDEHSSWLATLAGGLLAGLGLWLALAWFDDLRQRSAHAEMPLALRGLPIELIGAGVLSMALCGLNGLFGQ